MSPRTLSRRAYFLRLRRPPPARPASALRFYPSRIDRLPPADLADALGVPVAALRYALPEVAP